MTADTPREPETEAMERLGREAFLEWADVIGLSDSQINTDWSPFMAGFRARAAGLREAPQYREALQRLDTSECCCRVCNCPAHQNARALLAAPGAER